MKNLILFILQSCVNFTNIQSAKTIGPAKEKDYYIYTRLSLPVISNELEIYTDNVKCSHGSTTGQLDDDALFYLQARGISKEKSRYLLVQAFVSEVLSEITNEKLNKVIYQTLNEQFDWDM